MKKIYSNFVQGLSSRDREGPDGAYYIGRELDPYRSPGYIRPGWSTSDLTLMSTVTNLIVDISDVYYGINQVTCTAIDDGGRTGTGTTKVYALNASTGAVTSSPDWPHSIANEIGRGVTNYECNVSGTSGPRVFYICDSDMGIYTGTFDDDWMSTVPRNAAAFTSTTDFHPYLKWKSFLWLGDGQYVRKLDGLTGTDGVLTANALDLGTNWHITTFFPTKNYIGICATERIGAGTYINEDKYRARSKIFMWDGGSIDYNYSVPVGDNIVRASINNNGIIQLFTSGRQAAGTIKVLGEQGAETIKFIKHDIDGTETDFNAPYDGALDMYKGRTLFGSGDQNVIMSYGREEIGQPYALSMPYANISSSTSQIGAIRVVNKDKIFFSCKKGTNYYLQQLKGGNSPDALLKEDYSDMGQRVQVNYVKFYFKPLESGDSATISLDTDYGTSNSLGTISYAASGAISSKLIRKPIVCHAFRPVVDWTAGGMAISKIVVDYTFIGE